MTTDVIVAFADGKPVTRTRTVPRLDALRKRLWSVLAVGAAVDSDPDTMQRVSDAMGLDKQAAEFLWLCLDYAIRADSFLRSTITEQRLDSLVRDRALALIDATDEIFRTCTAQEETMNTPDNIRRTP